MERIWNNSIIFKSRTSYYTWKNDVWSVHNNSHDIRMRSLDTNQTIMKLWVTQWPMERCMLAIIRRDSKMLQWIRQETQLTDVIRSLKWQCAGHIARRTDNRWTTRITMQYPRGIKKTSKLKMEPWHKKRSKYNMAQLKIEYGYTITWNGWSWNSWKWWWFILIYISEWPNM